MSRHSCIAAVALSLCCVTLIAAAGERSRTVNEGGIADEWTLVPGTFVAPGYPAVKKANGDNVCVAIGYAIDTTGTPGDFIVLREWSDGANAQARNYYNDYAVAGAGALSQWRFAPREGVTPRRTITVATMTFRGKQAIDVPALADNCKITDLVAELQDANNENMKNGDLRRELEASLRRSNQTKQMINPISEVQGSLYHR